MTCIPMLQIHDLSNEFYYLIPRADFETYMLPPIESMVLLRENIDLCRNLLEIDTATKLLLAAQHCRNGTKRSFVIWLYHTFIMHKFLC